MITIVELSKRYGPTLALDRLSLQVPEGAVFGLLGPNGAGKTTLLRLIMGFVFPDVGSIERNVPFPAGVGYLPERSYYPPRFTAHEYLTTISRLAGLRGSAAPREADQLLVQFGLAEVARRRLGACSRGMLQRLGLAQAMAGDPPLFLLDEPARGLDPAGQKFMRDKILQLHEAGRTIILSSHHLDEVTRICTHIGVLNKGCLVRSGELEALLAPQPHPSVSTGAAGPLDLGQVTIGTGPIPAELVARLTSLAPGIAVAGQRITLSDEAVSHKPEVLRLLLDAEVDVQQLTTQRVTLEDVYLRATHE